VFKRKLNNIYLIRTDTNILQLFGYDLIFFIKQEPIESNISKLCEIQDFCVGINYKKRILNIIFE
jgi:hypothetical protein